MTDAERVRAEVRAAGGPELLDRLEHLDARRVGSSRLELPVAPAPGDTVDYDVALAGGGLWSLLAPVLAVQGLRVAVFDRGRIATCHREWNASFEELQALVQAGIVTREELPDFIVAAYDFGTCRFGGGPKHRVDGVLDRAVDAGKLLAHGRALGEARGVTYFDHHAVLGHAAGPESVRLSVQTEEGTRRDLTAKVLIDARGATSPFATADLLCPTVGGVLRGLAEGEADDEVNPRVGEILATIDGVEDGRQHVWEAFPGRPGETTVYLFYYARASEPFSLVRLYARFFATLPDYKRGEATLVRPTFGLIPGWSRLSPAPAAPDPRTYLVGDAAARHSSLTYCGFGSMLRLLVPTAQTITTAVREARPRETSASRDRPIHALTGGLAHVMASRGFHEDQLNALLDSAFQTLASMGNDTYASLLRDTMTPAAFAAFLYRLAKEHPAVWRKVVRALDLTTASRWFYGVFRGAVWGTAP